jgi:D-arabinose 1-dehydrogenase-like Zn-dependent alcohol dehydrogenase
MKIYMIINITFFITERTGGNTMRSAWVIGRETIKILKKDYEKPSNNEVVVRVRLCGICGTDLYFLT